LLLPLCPYFDPDKEEHPHFVQRGALIVKNGEIREPVVEENRVEKGHFFCTTDQDHAQMCIMECSYCGLPLREDAVNCPRCKRWVEKYDKELADKENRNAWLNCLNINRLIYLGDPPKASQRKRCRDVEEIMAERKKKNSAVIHRHFVGCGEAAGKDEAEPDHESGPDTGEEKALKSEDSGLRKGTGIGGSVDPKSRAEFEKGRSE